MALSAQDERYLRRALSLAAETTALASPNPQVGCVLVRDDQILGEGAHRYEHRDHAEIVALKDAAAKGHAVRGATAYVTLEPCSHHGRTGPCADALAAAGIGRVVIGTQDANPIVSGNGIARLRAAGVTVTLADDPLRQQARDLIESFAHFIRHRTPFVTLKAALSADGKLAPSPAMRIAAEPVWLTGPDARAEVQRLRHASDAILTGIGTVLADDPALTDRSGIISPGGLPRRRPLLRVLLDTHLRIPADAQLLRTAAGDLLILCSEDAPLVSQQRIEPIAPGRVELQRVPIDSDGRLSLPAVLAVLAERNLLSVLLECGSHLNAAFLRQNLVDKVVLFRAPVTLGDDAIPFAGDISPAELERSLTRTTRTTFDPDTCTTGYLHDPWA